jgi:hypothetical protein
MIHDTLRLYVSNESYAFEPVSHKDVDQKRKKPCLILNRRTSEVTCAKNPGPVIAREAILVVYGIIGIIRLNAGRFF